MLNNKSYNTQLIKTISNDLGFMSCGISKSGFLDSDTSSELKLTYIKKPSDPNWAYNTVNNIEIYNSSNATQITLSDSTHKEIANRILGYIGVNLRESEIITYSESKNEQQKT